MASKAQGPDLTSLAAKAADRAAAVHKHIMALPAERFRGQPEALVSEIEAYGHDNGVPMLFGPPKMAVARKALSAQQPRPRVLLEFGAYFGYSALRWANLLVELNAGASDVHVYTFELDPAFARIARDFVEITGLTKIVSVLEGPGDESVKKLVADGVLAPKSVDVVFIDHWEVRYLPDLRLCESLGILHVGSLIVADNTDMPGAPDYLAYVRAGGSNEPGALRFTTESLEAGEGPAPPHRRPESSGPPGSRPGGSPPGGGRPGRRRPNIVEISKVVGVAE